MTGLINVFAFQYARLHSDAAPSTSDPYLLPLPNDGSVVLASRANPPVSHRSRKISAILLKAVKYESPQGSTPSGMGRVLLENDIAFYQLSVLTNDLAVSECLYAEVPNEFKAEVRPPNTVNRLEIARTPANVVSDFIVPHGDVDRDYGGSPHKIIAEEESDPETGANPGVLHEDLYTISFERLENEFHSTSTDAFINTGFHENLDLLQDEIEDKFVSEVPTVKTL